MSQKTTFSYIGWLVSIVVIMFLATACTKEKFLTQGGSISFSADTLLFDTVFTAQGSATRSLLIYNKEKQKLKISSIRLAKGEASPYRINVNGVAGKEVKDMELAANDSMYVFSAVTIDPTDENTPFVVEDELIVTVNGSDFKIPVIGFGQNAHYIVGAEINTQTWTNDKPYIIINSALVTEGSTLTISAGTRVYMHANSTLFVLGTLKVNGTKTDSVVFQGDRIDRKIWVGSYEELPGEWGGIYFDGSSRDNEINYAIIKNGGRSTPVGSAQTTGALIQLSPEASPGASPMLKITNATLFNSSQFGILAFNSSLYAENCLIADCQFENLALLQGGNYKVYDCTIASYGLYSRYFTRSRGHVSAVVQNFFATSQTTYVGANLHADIKNCIITGNSTEDILFINKKDDFASDITLHHCLVKIEEAIPSYVTQLNNLINVDPKFSGVDSFDFHLSEGSPAIGAGISAGDLNVDLDGKLRSTPPSIGCYEF
jgi:hypothetical protein